MQTIRIYKNKLYIYIYNILSKLSFKFIQHLYKTN